MPAVIAWDGGPTGNGTNWLDAANWRDAGGNDALPGAGDDVTVDATGSSPIVVIGASTAVRSISSTRTLQLTGGTLTLGATANRFYLLTLGLIALVVNGLLFLLTEWIADQAGLPFEVDGFWPAAVLGALFVGLVTWLLGTLLDRD